MIALLAVVLTTPALHAQCPTDAYVGYQAANGTDHFATIMDAYDAVCAGGTIHINSGIYAESIEIDDSNAKDGVTFLGDPAGSPIDYPIVTGGVRTTNSVNINGMTLQNMIVQGLATNANGVFDCDNSGLIVNLTLDGVTIECGELGDAEWWWCNVRASNTEPLLRLNLEANTSNLRDKRRDQVVQILGEPVS